MILSIGFYWLFASYLLIKKGIHPLFRNTKTSRDYFMGGWVFFYLGIVNLSIDYEWFSLSLIITLILFFIGIAVIDILFKIYTPHIKEDPFPAPRFRDYMTWDTSLIYLVLIFMLSLEAWFLIE